MHIRADHAELDVPTLHAFLRSYPLGHFTTAVKHESIATLQTSHIPFVLDAPGDSDGAGDYGTLRGHMARANPQAKALIAAARAGPSPTLPDEVLILFNAPVHAYVTANFYKATKPTTHKVVPTWNYAAVQVYGTLTVREDVEFIGAQIRDLSDRSEEAAGYSGEQAWKVSDAPERYISILQKAIVGIEIKISRIEGRFKLSQESGDRDWVGIVEGFRGLGTKEGEAMAEMIEQRGTHRNV